MTLLIIFVILAIGVSFLCSILEAVLLSITPSYVEAAQEERPGFAAKMRALRADIERPLAAILSLNTIAHTVGATGAGAQAAVVFDDFGVGVFSALLTLGILILSEIIPKTLGATYWRALAPFAVRVIPWLIWAQLPLVWMSQAISKFLKSASDTSEVSREEITALATAGHRLGVVEADEQRVVTNLFNLPDILVREVMTPRTVIDHVQADATVSEVVNREEKFSFSRLPVVGESLDDVHGFILIREVLTAALHGGGDNKISEFCHPLSRVSEDMDLDTLLDRLLENDVHLALVEDAYGGTAGLVSMEDAFETLLGTEIVDEHDEAADMQAVALGRAKRRAGSVRSQDQPE